MKKGIILSMAMVAGAFAASADITVNFPAGTSGEYQVDSQLISEALKPRAEATAPVTSAVSAEVGKNVIKNLEGGPARYVINMGGRQAVMLFGMPDDHITVDITSTEPLEYTVSGTELMDGISALRQKSTTIENKFRAISRSENPDEALMEALGAEYDNLFKNYIKENPNSPVVAYAVYSLDGEDFIQAFETMTPEAKKSIFYPVTESKKAYVEQQIAMEKKMAEMQSGNYEAPAFTFKDMDGKDVSLSDFRGKWVVIDFWGSWCPWCIKGFPQLKEAYAKYHPELEVVGVACNDPEPAWRNAVKKYELPWVNLFNPEPKGGKLVEEYAVQGFPTKVVVNPEGKIANITVGEDPSFFDKLANLMGK